MLILFLLAALATSCSEIKPEQVIKSQHPSNLLAPYQKPRSTVQPISEPSTVIGLFVATTVGFVLLKKQ